MKPTQQQIQEAADNRNGYLMYAKNTKAPIFKEGFLVGASYMQQQLEPIITELEMENARVSQSDNIASLQQLVEQDKGFGKSVEAMTLEEVYVQITKDLYKDGCMSSKQVALVSMERYAEMLTEQLQYKLDQLQAENVRLGEEMPVWVDVNDRLPSPEENVLTLLRDISSGKQSIQITRYGIRKFVGIYDPAELMEVTHWMPLPLNPNQ